MQKSKLPARSRRCRPCLYLNLPVLDYSRAWDLQLELVDVKKNARFDWDVLLLLEHPPVFTLGRRGGRENLTVSETCLKQSGIPVVHVERGGDITFHGPGQLVGYPIIDLKRAGLTVVDYVYRLEEVMIRTAAQWGLKALRNPVNRGIWIGNAKLGSLGIAVRRGICFHGFAFNATIGLDPFGWINPCGLKGVSMTSLSRELSSDVSMPQVRRVVMAQLESVLGLELKEIRLSELRGLLKAAA